MTSLLWPTCGYTLLKVNDQNQLVLTDAFLRHSLHRPELLPIETSCAKERDLFNLLREKPRVNIDAETLNQLANHDVSDNYRVWLRFRDRLLVGPTLEASYKLFFNSGSIDFPPILIDEVAQVLVKHVLGPKVNAMQARIGEMFFRSQTVTVKDRVTLLAVDSQTLEQRAVAPDIGALGKLLKKGGIPISAGDLTVLTEDNDERYWKDSEAFQMAVMLNWGQPAVAALCLLIEQWVLHLLHAHVTVKAVGAIEDEQWVWHLGLDVQSTGILNDLYVGKTLDTNELSRLLVLFQLSFIDPSDMLQRVAGKPIHMAIAMDAQNQLKIKPQNLLTNLPIALRS